MTTTGETTDRDPLRPTDHTTLLLHVLRPGRDARGRRHAL